MRWLVVLLLLLPSLQARAEGTVTQQVTGTCATYAGAVRLTNATGEACIANLQAFYGANGCINYYISGTQVRCYTGGVSGVTGSFTSQVTSCPSNSTGPVPNCVCNSGYQPNETATACIQNTCNNPAGTTYSTGFYNLGTSDTAVMPTTICAGSCLMNFEGTGSAISRTLVGGTFNYYAQGSYGSSGFGCAPDTQGAPVAVAGVPPSTCATGQSVGWINGTPICYTTQGDTPAPVTNTTTTTTGYDPQSNPTVTETLKTASGDTITTTKTTNPDGSVSTTIVNQGADSSDKEAFCAANPTSAACDARSECEKNPDSIGCMEAGTATDSESLGTQSISLGITPINFGIAPGCPADRQISVWGGVVVPIPPTQLCSFADLIKPLVLAMAWLAAGFIVFGSFRTS